MIGGGCACVTGIAGATAGFVAGAACFLPSPSSPPRFSLLGEVTAAVSKGLGFASTGDSGWIGSVAISPPSALYGLETWG